ncbi:hypothetical protein SAY86_015543 [Trapa natans]|uniref:Protein TIFY n=1 Tax=Trapa natans TaxID=22666 RepID=A0AAN7QYL6_TRANT|nr:hypothetical protein SAY86_015543 [Trapa natans]
MMWSFSNKSSRATEYLPFRESEEERKDVHGQLDLNHKSNATGVQHKAMAIDEAAYQIHCPISSFPIEHCSTHSSSRYQETSTRMLLYATQPNQSATVAVSPSVVHSHIHPITKSPRQFGRAPPLSVPPTSDSVVGYTDLRSGCKQHPEGPAQLTIFYAGSVNVFDDISPEKARAVMLFAEKGAGAAHHKSILKSEVSGPLDEDLNRNRAQSSSSHAFHGAAAASQGKQMCKLDLATLKSMWSLEPPLARQEPRHAIHSLGSPSTPLFSTVALPQARKASLTRFLEKRKERVMSTTPYPTSNKSPESSI